MQMGFRLRAPIETVTGKATSIGPYGTEAGMMYSRPSIGDTENGYMYPEHRLEGRFDFDSTGGSPAQFYK